MSDSSETMQKMQYPAFKNIDEMSQQTLDALKVVHSFESKPARSVKIREMLKRKEDQNTVRAPLVPIRALSSPERRFQGSPRVLRPSSESGTKKAAAQIANSHGGYSLMRPAKEGDGSARRIGAPKEPSFMKPFSRIYSSAKSEDTSRIKPTSVSRGFLKSSLNPRGSAALPATRAKGSSTASISRLLQPTAASVAKVNPRALQRPASKGPISSMAKFSSSALSEFSRGVMTQSNTFLPAESARFKPESSNLNNSGLLAKSNMPLFRPNAVVPTEIPISSKISTPNSKAVPGKQPPAQATCNEPKTVNPSLLALDQSKSAPKTSTPSRVVIPLIETSPSMQSIDYSNFSNFSYVAEWARTPELAKQTFAQQQVDTTRLFGAIPPVDIDAIFGAEIQRQQR